MSKKLEVRLLGRYEVSRDGKIIAITSRPAQSLFAYLILGAGTAHRREKLAGLLWPDSLEETARDNLRHALWRMRKALPQNSKVEYVLADDLSIAFNTASEYWLDASALENLSDSSTADELMAVLSEYQGELLPGFYDEWVALEREHLNSIFEHKMARLMSLLQDEKRWLEILDWGERWIKLGQKPEPAYRALMSAHAAKGDMSKVAATYERCVRSLRELGIEPSEQTRKLYEKIKTSKGNVENYPSSVPSLGIRKSTPRTNLPASTTSFIGREIEVAGVREYLLDAHIRLVTLIGPPGIGKTRLSLEVARETLYDFPDGVFFVALAPLEDASLMALTIVQTLDFAETKNRPPIERLKEGIGNKQMLLVLDNLEQIIEESALLISELLTSCHYLKIVTTSREALRVSGEWLYPLPALNIPTLAQLQSIDGEGLSQFAALMLFAERARAVRPDFVLNAENSEAVANICTQLDGLPLAIELIAARIALMSPQALLERLNSRFILYADGVRAVTVRQKTLHGAIAWSYDLLSPEEQKMFVKLSIFAGGFTLDAAESIFSRMILDKPVSDLIASLSNKSLLQRTFDTRGELRFNMLVTIQQFALDRLHYIGEETETCNLHLAYFLSLAEHADREIHGPDQIEWIERVESEHDNLNAAFDWCVVNQKTESALRLLCALGWIWGLRGHYTEARGWFDKIRTMPGLSNYPGLYAKVLNHIGRLYCGITDFDNAHSVLEESQAIWMQMGVEGELGLAECLRVLGAVARSTGQGSVVAKSYFDRGLELYQKYEDTWGLAHTIHLLGINATDQQQDESAQSMFEQSIALFGQIGDSYGIARVSLSLAHVYLNVGNYKKARMSLEQGLIIAEKIQFRLGMELALGSLGDLNRYQGRYREAEEFYKRSLALCHEYGLKGDMGWNLQNLGLLALHQDDYSLARQYFTDCYDLVSRIYEKDSAYNLISGLAAVAGGTNQPERAAKLSGAAQTILKTIDIAYPPLDNAELDRHIKIARAELGERAFETLQAEGRVMTMEQAVEFALKEAK